MLPDWPIPKQAIFKVIKRLMQKRAHGMSIVDNVPHQPVFEGHALSIRRADGVVDQSDFHLASGAANVPVEAIKSGRLEDVLNALMPVSTEAGAAMAKYIYQTIEAGVKSVGNELSAGGKPMTAELILDALDKVLVDFDADGQPKWPTIVVHPSLSDRLKAEDARFGSEPALAQRFAEITERKREQWRAREASRVLVG
jgi:hypothetical protein